MSKEDQPRRNNIRYAMSALAIGLGVAAVEVVNQKLGSISPDVTKFIANHPELILPAVGIFAISVLSIRHGINGLIRQREF